MLNKKEIILLQHLRKNSRKSLADISKETKIPVSTLFNVLKRLESKAIARHTSLIDFGKAGYTFRVCFALSSRQKKALKEFLIKSQKVNNLYSLTNDHDFFVECIFKSMQELIWFREELEKYKLDAIEETFIIDELKREEFCPII